MEQEIDYKSTINRGIPLIQEWMIKQSVKVKETDAFKDSNTNLTRSRYSSSLCLCERNTDNLLFDSEKCLVCTCASLSIIACEVSSLSFDSVSIIIHQQIY